MKSPTKRSLSVSGCRACSLAPGHLRTSVKVEDDGDGLDGSVQAFERLGESNSMDDLGVRWRTPQKMINGRRLLRRGLQRYERKGV